MPWVRIDEKAIDHPKFIAISANAWRLWCEGQSYCQKYLTDGLIPKQALKGFRYYSPASFKMLTTELVPGKGPLWHESPGGVSVHDYLDWNDSRETVLKARAEAKDRKRRWRDKHVSFADVTDASGTRSETRDERSSFQRDVVCREERSVEEKGGSGGNGDRVQRFVERYGELYEQYRHVGYLGNPQKDYQAACELVAMFDDAMLEAIAAYGLNDPDKFMQDGTLTLTKLKSRASGIAAEIKSRKLLHHAL